MKTHFIPPKDTKNIAPSVDQYIDDYIPHEVYDGEVMDPPYSIFDEAPDIFANTGEVKYAGHDAKCNPPPLKRGVTYDSPPLVKGVTYDDTPEVVIETVESKDSEVEQSEVRVYKKETVSFPVNNVVTELPASYMVKPPRKEIFLDQPLELLNLNFSMNLEKRIIHFFDTIEGENNECTYVIRVIIHKMDGSFESFIAMVPSHKAKQFDWVRQCTHSLAKTPTKKEEKDIFESMVQKCIENNHVPIEYEYPNAGWRLIPNVGWGYVFSDGIIGEPGMKAYSRGNLNKLDINEQELYTKSLFEKAMRMNDITGENPTSKLLFLFLHAAFIDSLYERTGHEIRYLFGIVGMTNSRKTSMVTAMTQVFDRKTLKAHGEFATSTDCGVEKLLGKYRDGIVIIDDFKPGANSAQSSSLSKRLDDLVRMVGDRVGKNRMNDYAPDGDKKFFPITSMCVSTMEFVNGIASTISRMFLVEIDGMSVNNQLLGYYQENKWILPTYMYSYLAWVRNNFEFITGYIENRFPILRAKYSFVYSRYCEMYATFVVAAEIFTQYAWQNGFMSETQIEDYLAQIEPMVAGELISNGEKAKHRDKSYVVVSALQDAFLHGKIRPEILTAENAPQKLCCYEDEEFVFVRTKFIKNVVNEFCTANNELFNVKEDGEMIDLLEKINLLDIHVTKKGRERSRKLKIQNENDFRYLYLKKSVIRDLFKE